MKPLGFGLLIFRLLRSFLLLHWRIRVAAFLKTLIRRGGIQAIIFLPSIESSIETRGMAFLESL
ncbi:hypothetical protein ABD86_09785 [Paenibacillus alvei]|nr:hypothetical protein [Paenibacillus alvei]MBG9744239.1 hypothetical protein [Paenibacillus alvei]